MPPQSQVCQKIFSYNASHLFTESSPLQDRRDREQLLTHCPQSPKVTAERSVFLARWSSWTWPFSASEPTGGGSLCDRPRETPSQARGAVGDTGSNSGQEMGGRAPHPQPHLVLCSRVSLRRTGFQSEGGSPSLFSLLVNIFSLPRILYILVTFDS